MPTDATHRRLAQAQEKFNPVAHVLDRLALDIEKEYGRTAVLTPQGAMEQTAENAYAVRYSLRQPEEARFALTFIVVGEGPDLLLVQGHERTGPGDPRSDPGQVDQHVYRLQQVDEIKAAVKARIVEHLRARGVLH